MRLMGFLALVVMSTNLGATVTVDQPDCPVQFEGRVKQMVEEVGPSNPLSTQKVIFENHSNVKGDAGQTVALDVLKHGPFPIEKGEDYLVQVRDGKLCWIEKL